MAANEPYVHKWFVEYEKVLHDFKITSLVQIWSADETGIQNILKEEKRSPMRNVNQPIKPLLLTKGKPLWC